MAELQSIDTSNSVSVDAGGTSPGTPQLDAASILARNDTGNNTHDLAGIGRDLAQLAQQDPVRADQVRAQVEQQLPVAERGNLPQHVRVDRPLPDGSSISFDPNGLEQTRWIEQARVSTDPTTQNQYSQLVQIAGGSERTGDLLDAFGRVFRGEATLTAPVQQQITPGADGGGWTQWGGAVLDRLNPLNPLMNLVQPAIADLGRQADLANTEWGAPLQRILDSPQGFAAFRQGFNQGLLEGGQDFVTGVLELGGRAVQYGADNSPLGDLGDGLRGLTGQIPGALNEIVPSSRRGDESNAALGRMGTSIGNYISSRASQPELIGQDISNGISRIWDSVKADHAAAAAQGPETEARWFGQLAGRVTFEVASTFVPIAGQVRKVDAAADGVRVLDQVAAPSRGADELADATRAGDEVADVARTAVRVENGRLIIDGNRGQAFSVGGAQGHIGDVPTTFRNAEGKPFARDVDGNEVQLNQPATTFDQRIVNPDGTVTYVRGNETVTYSAGGFPIFREVRAEVYLDATAIKTAKDGPHFREANRLLGDALRADPGLAERIGLTPDQVAHLTRARPSNRAPEGLVWHHHQDTGRMQLMDEHEHNLLPGGHTGGMRLWGGGRS